MPTVRNSLGVRLPAHPGSRKHLDVLIVQRGRMVSSTGKPEDLCELVLCFYSGFSINVEI